MLFDIVKKCDALGVKHTFHKQNLGFKAFNTLRHRKFLCKAVDSLVNDAKYAQLKPAITSLLPEDLTVDYTYDLKGVVYKLTFSYGDNTIQFVYR